METKNFLTLTAANIRINFKATFLPAVIFLFAVPFFYGTANLDHLQSAACLERMAALAGIPMFAGLVRQEYSRGLLEIIGLRQISFRSVILLRIGISVIGMLLLICGFAVYMGICGCSFPFWIYAIRTLAAGMALGLAGLLVSLALRNTAGGYLGAFCFYFAAQMGYFGDAPMPVTNGVGVMFVLFLGVVGLGVLYFCGVD